VRSRSTNKTGRPQGGLFYLESVARERVFVAFEINAHPSSLTQAIPDTTACTMHTDGAPLIQRSACVIGKTAYFTLTGRQSTK
jgi:hypothetical protein